MRRAHDFGDAESLALDGDGLAFEDEQPAARIGQEREDIRRSPQGEDRRQNPPAQAKPRRDLRKIALLVLIGWLLAVMAGLFLWQKFVGLQPVSGAAQEAGAMVPSIGGAAPPSAPRVEPASPLPPARAGVAAQAATPVAASAPALRVSTPGDLGAHGGQGVPAAKAKAVASHRPEAQALPPKSEKNDSLEAKVARLEKEVKALSERDRAPSQRQAATAGRAKKNHASREGGKVVGMSSTSVWVRKANGEMAELQVGDHFKNDEVIQRIDQQAQVVETDRGRYKVGL